MKIKRIIVFFLVLFLLGTLSYFQPRLNGNFANYEPQTAKVIRVIDGDTIEVQIKESKETVRLLGIDTPERGEGLYQEAKEFLQITQNQTIELLRDWDDEGKYYRKLRYVFYNNRNLNIELVELGLAEVFMEDRLIYENKFLRAEEYAKENQLGIWSPNYVK